MNYKSISLISGTLLLSTLSANGQTKDSKPNIIFILCDDMGYGDLGCYGQDVYKRQLLFISKFSF